ncbi:hypothetical protein HZB02_01245 [Candidatus Woesearchaeota archaeon]|nr:hypothetical protein [Candidatus Woesearchaeota archaeon]
MDKEDWEGSSYQWERQFQDRVREQYENAIRDNDWLYRRHQAAREEAEYLNMLVAKANIQTISCIQEEMRTYEKRLSESFLARVSLKILGEPLEIRAYRRSLEGRLKRDNDA